MPLRRMGMGHMNDPRHHLGVETSELKGNPACRRVLSIPLVDHLHDLEVVVEVNHNKRFDYLGDGGPG